MPELLQFPRQHVAANAADSGGTYPQVAGITERICYRFEQGALERYIAKKFEVCREFIEAVIRREFRRLRAENQALKSEIRDLQAELRELRRIAA